MGIFKFSKGLFNKLFSYIDIVLNIVYCFCNDIFEVCHKER